MKSSFETVAGFFTVAMIFIGAALLAALPWIAIAVAIKWLFF